jgi:hypothetical protein
MKRTIFVMAAVLGLSSSALALNYLGPPTAHLQAGQWEAGISYCYSMQDIKLDDFELDDAKENMILGRLGVGLVTSRFEIAGLAGAGDLERDPFETDFKFLLGGAFRATMWEGGDLDWGIVGQGTYLSTEDRSRVLGRPSNYDLSLGEIQLGLGPCWRHDWAIVYGGAMFHWFVGTMDDTVLGDFEVREKTAIGGYLGGGLDVDKCWTFTAEIQATPDAFGYSTGIQLRF